jgi:TPR repeat protein
LGLCYKFGDGVKQSYRWAMHYFKRATKLKNKKAVRNVKELERFLQSRQ